MTTSRRDDDEVYEERRRWRIKREVSTGDLLLAVSMLAGLFLWGSGIDKRLAAVEERQASAAAAQARVDAVQDQALRDSMNLVLGELRDIKQYLLSKK